MFSPDRFGPRRASFAASDGGSGRNFIGLKTAFRNRDNRTQLQRAAHFRFSEPATPSVLKDRGLRPSDLSDPHKKQFLTELTGRIFHLAVSGVDHGEDGEKKISLERLFTPATDSGDLTPRRKKAYASSSFYRPDHPTIDDQVELAQRISFSLVDENNKMSRGQSMYMKRKKRSMRWIHEGPGSGSEAVEDEPTQRTPTKPAMKLLMNPKGVQDFHAVQEHYQALMNAAPPSPEVGKIVTEVQSPTGKGAELFAKRKKRMDQFIVDETTVQKAHQQQITTSQQSFSSTSNFSSASTSTSNFTSKKQAEYERNRQQEQILEQFLKERESSITMIKSPWQAALETGCAANAFQEKERRMQLADTVCERADAKVAAAPWLEMTKPLPMSTPSVGDAGLGAGSFNLPDLTKILTQPTKSESSKPKLEPLNYKPTPLKSKSLQGATPSGCGTPRLPTGLRVSSNSSRTLCSPVPPSVNKTNSPLAFSPKTFSPLYSSPSLFSHDHKATLDSAHTQTSTGIGSYSLPEASNLQYNASVSAMPTTSFTSSNSSTSLVFPKLITAANSPKPFIVGHSSPGSFPSASPKYKPVKLALVSGYAGGFSPKPISSIQHPASDSGEKCGSYAAPSVLPSAASSPFVLPVKSSASPVSPVPNPGTATVSGTLVSSESLPGSCPSTFPTNVCLSSVESDAATEQQKPETLPSSMLLDCPEAISLNDDTTNLHDESSSELSVPQLITSEACLKFGDSLHDSTLHKTLTTDEAAALDLQGVNPEVSNYNIFTACSSCSNNNCNNNVSSSNHKSRVNSSTSKTNSTSSNYKDNKPAQPSSLLLIPSIAKKYLAFQSLTATCLCLNPPCS